MLFLLQLSARHVVWIKIMNIMENEDSKDHVLWKWSEYFPASPIKRWSTFPHLLNLGWPCNLLWPRVYNRSCVWILNLVLKGPCKFLLFFKLLQPWYEITQVWLILCVNITGPLSAHTFGQTLFWVHLLEWLGRLSLELEH